MKILFLSKSNHVDYLCDCLFIGLKELFGSEVVDINPMTHIFTDYDSSLTPKLYGRGFTVTRVLENSLVDRSDIVNKIKSKYFDLIVYGSIWRYSDYLTEVLESYPPNKIAIVDGEDHTHIHQVFGENILYFKRELIYNDRRVFPITFAFPTSKFFNSKNKTKDISFINPLDRSTYIYSTEEEYFQDYRDSKYAITLKKAGWDCLRHYEIMGNGCVPIFLDIEDCPQRTMEPFPKELFLKLNNSLKIPKRTRNPNIISNLLKETIIKDYDTLQEKIFQICKDKLSTLAVAKKFIDDIVKV